MLGSDACSPNERTAFDFFTSRGLRDFQAAAIIGNLKQESGLDPLALNPNDAGLPAHGIAQWRGGRWDSLLAFASASGRNPNSLELQLDFILHELPSNGGGNFFAAATLEDATIAFQDGFERCGDCAPASRISFARSAFMRCPLIAPPTTAAAPSRAPVVIVTLGITALAAAAGYAALEERRSKRT